MTLGARYGLAVSIADLVMSTGQVSSSRVRECLAAGDTQQVGDLLGRPYRLLLELPAGHVDAGQGIPIDSALNQAPAGGIYRCRVSNVPHDSHEAPLLPGSNEFQYLDTEVSIYQDHVVIPEIDLAAGQRYGRTVVLDFL